VVCRSLDSRNIVPSCRTGTSSEIRNDNLQVTVVHHAKKEHEFLPTLDQKRIVLKNEE
jgi:hypothetical protein